MTEQREHYTMGYGPAATAMMAVRTAQSHAAFLLPHLKQGMSVLDCGCGPGTITLGFADVVAPGQVVGTEIEDSQVALARDNASTRGVSNVRFEVADIYRLPFADASFDAAFVSAVLANLREPGRGLREVHRVMRPGGVVGVKEFDHGGDLIHPYDPPLQKFYELYRRLREENGHEPDGGRKIGALLLDAGFREVPELFPDPDRFDPGRYLDGREEDATPFAWVPFGGGHHLCSGSAFAIMQLKAITMSLLRRFTFELLDPPDSYGPDYTKMVVQVRQPCRVRYRRRTDVARMVAARTDDSATPARRGALRVRVDLGLCQGHAVCVSEAPEVFRLNAQQTAVEVLQAEVPAALRERVAAAARHCPTHAITSEDT